MSQLNYYGYLITVFKQDDSYSYFVSSEFLKNKHQIDGFISQDDAFDDACCRIDAIIDSL
jgi:hypothetical protein